MPTSAGGCMVPLKFRCSISASNDAMLHWMSRPVKRSYRSGRRALTLVVDYGTALLERAGPLIITSIESAGADPDMRRIADQGAHATAVNLGAFARALADHGALRPGLDAQQAADVLLVLSSPHVHHLLRRDRGWSVERYRDWLLDTLTSTLLPDAGGRSAPSRSTRSATPEGGGAVVGGP